ncbi:type 1 periplasmic binding fold superfamily protein [Flavobacterium sp.]|uniref:type 1 periplasmic binding fold superfamily protein n=1 Tax=Flavobacterium sp. TaxID=239 RepID=UPI00261F7436|nr:type 1 periplasmic binding fold superfamily protein [Flavobacterium sp.]
MKTFKLTNKLFLSLFAVALISCSDDDNPAPVNEEEVITTVRTTLVAGGQTVTLLSRDLDGDGPNAPVVTVSGNLTAGTTYTGSVEFFNETINPADNITTEVEEEGVDHQIFYQAPASIGTFTYTDTDANGKPIGLDFTLVTASAATGNLTVTLRHLPNKSAAGVSTGNIANAGGATDAQVTYPLVVN